MNTNNEFEVHDNYLNLGINYQVGTIFNKPTGEQIIWDGTNWQPILIGNQNNNGLNLNYGYTSPPVQHPNQFTSPINTPGFPYYSSYAPYLNDSYGVGVQTSSNNFTVFTKHGRAFNIADTLQKIVDLLGLIEPDIELSEKYPSVKAAYENYEEVLKKQFENVREAIKNYETVVKLVKIDNNSDDENEQQG